MSGDPGGGPNVEPHGGEPRGVEIDGSRGEGGGQILRTSLALSMITGRPMHMRRIRAGRAKPGLRRQHLACVDAAARMSGATVRGAEVGSQAIEFIPGSIARWAAACPEELVVDIGSAGSTTLVVQTILIPAIVGAKARLADTVRPFRAVITGGTHNPMAPPFEFLERVFAPQLAAMGANVRLVCERPGFVPAGGGRLVVEVSASSGRAALAPIELVETGAVSTHRAIAVVCGLPAHIAERELRTVRARLALADDACEVREVKRGGPSNILMIEVQRGATGELVSGHGAQGLRAEILAERACDAIAAFLARELPVGEHLADQLLLPMAIAGGGRFRTGPLSLHATTNIDSIRAFLDIAIAVTEVPGGVEVVVGPRRS